VVSTKEGSDNGSPQSAIFLCDQEGLEICLQRHLIGTAESCVGSIRRGDFLFLYHQQDQHLYGIWSTVSEVGVFDSSPWGQRNPIQIRVERASETLVRLPGHLLVSALGSAALDGKVLTVSEAQVLMELVRLPTRRPQRPSSELPLVRWSAWAVLVALLLLAMLVLWGLATHKPSPLPDEGGI
jgi:hypothetical protein